jgi:predicted kinase
VQAGGKSTLAHALGERLQAPVVSLDILKEDLHEAMLGQGLAPLLSNEYGILASKILGRILEVGVQPIIIEGWWYQALMLKNLSAGLHDFVEIYCMCPLELAWERYMSRLGTRPLLHQDREYTREEFVSRVRQYGADRPLGITARMIQVDTSTPINLDLLVSELMG